ncbi:polynucleotide phosphorylase/polyadenylase [Candidatus Nucleicultrix amoebiphila FS5]|jgi:polyribonucleotide nucleotidyltransferase|uniref:Polyribonucleotide nucleotidyltransferase n=2 Tax=Candidatus Nucleicultrix TaxID=1509243 RepID=A0A1W6N3V2_9PROT|nr:polynucleotide phosphorylase/polyadenylase [Candidatus Nucleicultrix amoebiphila FS5]
MFKIHREEIEWGGRTLSIETGKVARQAEGAVVITYGQTSLLCTVAINKSPSEEVGFFPLTVHYQERSFAAGKIPGGFFKRDGKPSEKAVLTSRLIDRPIRPLFPENFRYETQIICSLLSHDMENDPDAIAIIGASAAVALAGIPFHGPLAGARVGYIDGKLVLNPTSEQMQNSTLDLCVAGTEDGVLMVESEAKELSEETLLEAVMFGHKSFQPVLKAINKLVKAAGRKAWDMPEKSDIQKSVAKALKKIAEDGLRSAYSEKKKQDRIQKIELVKQKALESIVDEDTPENVVLSEFKNLEKDIVRGDLLKNKIRIDGRDLETIRPISAEVGIIPRVHGSALFTRGETQALVVTTLGTSQDEQIIDAIEGEYRENFLLHYNFPPYSVGEVGRVSSPGRREIGHGKLAWRAVHPMIPTKDKFPYTLHVVSEVTESNGSSSMATVCGSSLALMDAGVPIEKPVAGIAMGLIKEGKKFAVLSDILGDEDHLGDMDFKVAGSADGVTALQMDIKVTGITEEIMQVALTQAKQGRLHILKAMGEAIDQSRDAISPHAPRIESIQVAKDKIREIIGPGGKTIREICETTGTRIEIKDDGTVDIAGTDEEAIKAAMDRIRFIVAEPEVGNIYKAKVAKLMDFGAFVDYFGGRSGLVHISQLATQRVESVKDVVNVGDEVYVKLIGFDERGKAKLSMKVVDQETGQEITNQGA